MTLPVPCELALPPGRRVHYLEMKIARWHDFLETSLDGRDYLIGSGFSVADAYAYAVLNWTNFTGIPLDGHPRVKRYLQRIGERPSVKAAFAAETKPA